MVILSSNNIPKNKTKPVKRRIVNKLSIMRAFFIILTFSILLTGCMTSNFTKTGDTYSALPEGYPVKVVLTGLDDEIEYEEIGALQVKQSDMNDLSKAVEFAKKKARERGGDIIFLLSSDSNTAISSYQFGVISEENNSYIFIVGKQI